MNDFYFPQPFGQLGQPQQRREVLFVNDAASAGRLPLLPGESALALDYTQDILYFVQADAAGSVAVREFEYKPREPPVDATAGATHDYVRRDEVEEIVAAALERWGDEHDKADAGDGSGHGRGAAGGGAR